jgi:hypothetical protein
MSKHISQSSRIDMTKEQILQEVATNKWQPEFKFTDDLDTVVDSILKPREDYFLGLHSKVKEIIEKEIRFCIGNKIYDDNNNYQITFVDVCNWQRELFEYKKSKIEETFTEKVFYAGRASRLPNQNIDLGLRQSNVKVGEWTPPAPMFLEGLKEMCFPINITGNILDLPLSLTYSINPILYENKLTDWYKIFEAIFYFEDFNYVLGQIVINVMSYVLTGKYLIRK